MMRAVRGRGSRRSPLRRIGRPLLSLALLTAGLLLAGAFVGIAVQQTAVEREAREHQEQIVGELARRAQLEAAIAERQTDAYVIDKARDLGYVRPGEGLIAVERGPARSPSDAGLPDVGRLGRWIAFFFGPH